MMARTVVVVGAATGIGEVVSQRARSDGATVVTWDVRPTADIVCDIADPGAIEVAVAETISAVGVPDEVTITAGVGHSSTLLDLAVDDFDRVLAINTRGPMLVMRAFAGAMREAERGGSMVAVSSISAHVVDRSMGAYCASKAALSALVRVAAAEWAVDGIRVNAIGPGVTDTPMLGGAPLDRGWLGDVAGRTALGRIGTPEDIAEAIEALHRLSWVTGQGLDVDGGLAMYSPINSYAEVLKYR